MSKINGNEINEPNVENNVVHHSECEETENNEEESDFTVEEITEYEKNHELLKNIKSWAIKFNVSLMKDIPNIASEETLFNCEKLSTCVADDTLWLV